MKIVNGKMVYGRKPCNCEDGTRPTRITCRTCKGTGRGVRGGVGKCKACYGQRREWDHEVRQVCDVCNGNYVDFQAEDSTDYLPKGVFENLEFKVYRTDENLTVNEYLIGLGCVWSCSDYGRAFSQTDAEVIGGVRSRPGSVQACKVAEGDIVCSHVGIFVKQNGYAVRAVYEPLNVVLREGGEDVFVGEVPIYCHYGAEKVGVKTCIWNPCDCGIERAWDLIGPLEEGLGKLREIGTIWHNGRYRELVSFVERYLAACIEHRGAWVSVGR